jgi:hypothetical protein
LKDKSRSGYTLSQGSDGPTYGVHFNARSVLDNALDLVPSRYKVLGPVILDAADFGAATRRPRLFIIGYDPDRLDAIALADFEGKKTAPATVRAEEDPGFRTTG